MGYTKQQMIDAICEANGYVGNDKQSYVESKIAEEQAKYDAKVIEINQTHQDLATQEINELLLPKAILKQQAIWLLAEADKSSSDEL